ncbi:magnesium and cobalt transport protein CorA [Nakamurella sp. GG22]
MTLIDKAVYVDGQRAPQALPTHETHESFTRSHGMAWIGLYRPEEGEILAIADEFDLHELPVEDAIMAHQRPKMERYGDTLFVVVRPARYLDNVEKVEFGELHIFVGRNFVITIRRAECPDLAKVRRRLETTPKLLRLGTEAVLYAILDEVVDEYIPVVAGLQNDIDEIENQLFERDPDVSRRIYELTGEVIEFQRATHALRDILDGLAGGFDKYGVDVELQHHLGDVADHVQHLADRADAYRALLTSALSVNATLVAQQQNEEMRSLTEASYAQNEEVKKISAWAAILFAPTLVGTVYGMNFATMPELQWTYGYPFAIALMLTLGIVLHRVFRSRRWL